MGNDSRTGVSELCLADGDLVSTAVAMDSTLHRTSAVAGGIPAAPQLPAGGTAGLEAWGDHHGRTGPNWLATEMGEGATCGHIDNANRQWTNPEVATIHRFSLQDRYRLGGRCRLSAEALSIGV
jgi:hypothetical protein